MSLSSASQIVFAILFFKIAYHKLLDHVAVTAGLFVVQTKLRMLISRDILNIRHAYAKWAWHFWASKFLLNPQSMVYLFQSMESTLDNWTHSRSLFKENIVNELLNDETRIAITTIHDV